MKKLGFVVMRYGLEVNGGAEFHCRQWAEKLSRYYDIEILTTQALDYMVWDDYYPVGDCRVNGIKVKRFPVAHLRDVEEFNQLCAIVAPREYVNREVELDWMEKQGPTSTELIEYLRRHSDQYDAFVFFSYLYYTSFYGLQAVKDKAILVPDAHDEWPIYLSIFDDEFKLPQAFFYNMEEEKAFVEKRFGVENIPSGIGGAGVDIPENINGESFKKKYGIDDYIIYVGRIDESKGCKELFEYFRRYKDERECDTKLVLLGRPVMEIPEDENIISLGFVSEEDKFNGVAGAKFLVLPSYLESLSIVVLEAFSLKKPVLVNGHCEVLKAHCEKSDAGLYYFDQDDFGLKFGRLLDSESLRTEMGERGKAYVDRNYSWDALTDNFNRLFDQVFGEGK